MVDVAQKYVVDVTKPISLLAKEIMSLSYDETNKSMHILNLIDFENDRRTSYYDDVCKYIYSHMPEKRDEITKIASGIF